MMRDLSAVLHNDLHRRASTPLIVDVDPRLDTSSFSPRPRSIPWTTEDGETHAICEMDGEFPRVLLPRIGIIRVLDDLGHLRGTVAHPDKVPVLEEVHYRFALPMILQAAGSEMLHASAVRVQSGVIALCGTSGTGKSTLAFSLSRRGHQHWADDSVVFLPHQNAFESLRLPFRPRVEIAVHERLDIIRGIESAPLAAIVVLRRQSNEMVPSSDFRTSVRKLSPADAFRTVLPHIYSFILSDPKRNALMMSRYFDIAAHVPVYDVQFTPCLDALPKLCEIVEQSCFGLG
jgi:hypothetical protein